MSLRFASPAGGPAPEQGYLHIARIWLRPCPTAHRPAARSGWGARALAALWPVATAHAHHGTQDAAGLAIQRTVAIEVGGPAVPLATQPWPEVAYCGAEIELAPAPAHTAPTGMPGKSFGLRHRGLPVSSTETIVAALELRGAAGLPDPLDPEQCSRATVTLELDTAAWLEAPADAAALAARLPGALRLWRSDCTGS